MRLARPAIAGLALATLAAPPAADAQTRRSLFPPEGCTPTSRVNPCPARTLPAPVLDPAGPLTAPFDTDPLDPPRDPLGFDAPSPKPRAPLLQPAHDRLSPGGKG